MLKYILFCFFIVYNVNSQPINNSKNSSSTTTPVSIIYQYETKSPDGSFNNSYQTSNGIKVENSGHVKNILVPQQADLNGKIIDQHEETIIVQIGSYSYLDPEGNIIAVQYIADENGFQPSGDHLPVAPGQLSEVVNQENSRIQGKPIFSYHNEQLGSNIATQPSSIHEDGIESSINNRPSFYSGHYIQNPQYYVQKDSSEFRQRQKRQLLAENRPIETGSGNTNDFVQHRPIESIHKFVENRPIETGNNGFNQNGGIEQNIRHKRQLLTQNRPIETGSTNSNDFVQHRPIETGLTNSNDFVQHRPIESGHKFVENRPIETSNNGFIRNGGIEQNIRHKRQLLTQNRPIETGSTNSNDFVQHRPIETGSTNNNDFVQHRPIQSSNIFVENRPIETGNNGFIQNRPIES